MQVSVESFGALGRRVKVAVPAERLEQMFTERLQRLTRQVRMPGFRPGKVPSKMVEAQYGGRLLQEVAEDLIQTTFREAIGREGLRPAGGPRIQQTSLARGREFEYTAEFEIYPEIKRLDLSGVRIERPVASISPEDVDRTLETIRHQRTTWVPVEREARNGDRVTVDFIGRVEGEPIEGGSATSFPLVLGRGTLLTEIESGLVGASAGETRTIAVRFPDDYRQQRLAGKTADFEVKVNEVAEPRLPEVNEELARQLGVDDGSVESLRTDVQANLEKEASERTRAAVRARAMQALLAANPFDVPHALLDAEVARLRQQDQALRAAGQTAGAQDEAMLRARAGTRVRLGLILAEIMRAKGIRPDAAGVRARVEAMAADYQSPQEFIQWYYNHPERLAEVESLVAEEQIVEEVLKTAEVVDMPMGFQQLLQTDTSVQ